MTALGMSLRDALARALGEHGDLPLLRDLRRSVIVTGWPDDVVSEAHALGLALDRAIARREVSR